MGSAQVICCTFITSFDSRLDLFKYKYVLIDEANQSTEPECILPLLRGAKQVVLVGDHMQLGPITKCRSAASAGLNRSLFIRLVHMGINPYILSTQYRMHPAIREFPISFFYENMLSDGVICAEREDPRLSNFWPNKIPVFFLHHKDGEGNAGSGNSIVNPNEAVLAYNVYKELRRLNVEEDQIAIITPYDAQKKFLLQIHHGLENVLTIDEFQGSEKNYIIFSSVRSNDSKSIGFLNDFRRLNVAITRAKYGLIIIGDAELLANSDLWANLIKFYSNNNMIFEGGIRNLRLIRINTPNLAPYDFRQNFPYGK